MLSLPLIVGQGSYAHADFSTNVTPEVDVDVNKRQSRLPPAVRDQLRANLPSVKVTPELDVYDAGFDAIWELDLWGHKRQLFRSSNEQLKAAYASYDAVMISLAAEVARTYVQIRTTDQRIAAMKDLVGTMNGFVKLTEERFQKKEAMITDVKLAKLLTGIVRSSIPQLESGRRQLENSLCVLLGKAPQAMQQDIGTTGTIPVAPLQSAVGIPADLLRRRPDVRIAEHMAAAECARVGMAKAAIMPSFSIFGSIGLKSSESGNFFQSDSVRSAYGGLVKVTSLINYPITVENVRLQDAQFEEALLNYRETVLNANLEVENSMYSFLKSQDEVAILEGNVKEAMDTVNLTSAAYKQGKVIVSIPLVALSFLASQVDQMWAWRGETTTDFVAIYKALGGGWQNRVGQELVPETIREQMKKQADWWTFTGKSDLSTAQDKKRNKKHD
jgi:NodT family efflux transporter outer membrane factor (OMF) lipoprotein